MGAISPMGAISRMIAVLRVWLGMYPTELTLGSLR